LSSNHLVEVVPGLYQIRLPIPIRSLGYVYAYFVRDGSDNLLIDTGWPSKESFLELQSSLSGIAVSLNQIRTMVVSHLHPDHFGLAEQIKDLSPTSNLIMHRDDASMILDNYDEYKVFIKELHEWLSEHGTPDEELKAMLDASIEMLHFFRPPKPTTIVTGGERIRIGDKWNFEVIPTPGHTIGTLCLYDHGSKVLFSGDHILPTITPNVSLGPYYRGDPLGDYLDSLDRVNKLDVSVVLPSHEYVFSNLQKRVSEIKAHHNERLEDAISTLNKAKGDHVMSGYQVASKLKWYSGTWKDLGAWERRAAVMETLAHLEYLKRKGKVTEVDEIIEGKPRIRFAVA
jgi:glyoxylase-like metal-dependent hydrolase (beta-lactamase superfamily II)